MEKRDKIFIAAQLLWFILILVIVFFLFPYLVPEKDINYSTLYLLGLVFAMRGLLFFSVLRIFYKVFSLRELLVLVAGACMILVALVI